MLQIDKGNSRLIVKHKLLLLYLKNKFGVIFVFYQIKKLSTHSF